MADATFLTPLHRAVTTGNADAVEKLLAVGASKNPTDADRATRLILAAELEPDRADIVLLLLKAGAEPNVAAEDGSTALHAAATLGCTDNIQLLLAHGASVHAALEGTRDTPLDLAVEGKHMPAIDLLLGAGAEVSHRTLSVAAATGHIPIVERLLQHGWFSATAAAAAADKGVAAADAHVRQLLCWPPPPAWTPAPSRVWS